MGKSKRRKLQEKHKAQKSSQPLKAQKSSKPLKATTSTTKPATPKPSSSSSHPALPPTIPFDPSDRILLIGEGDLSFALSLAEHHACTDLTATTHDNHDELLAKYPQSAAHIASLLDSGASVLHGVDATKLTQKELRKGALWDRIVFNFPHVGGKSTDVNRQVRYNQEMLVGFFRAAAPLLAAPGGAIVVTLFEGEPYTLWNVRDLARHCGLEVLRSFRFQSEAYPGYAHARTLGNLEGGGGWKGESRAARSFVFQAKKGDAKQSPGRKRKRGGDEEDSDG